MDALKSLIRDRKYIIYTTNKLRNPVGATEERWIDGRCSTRESLIGMVSRFARRNERRSFIKRGEISTTVSDFFLYPKQVFSRNARSRLFDL